MTREETLVGLAAIFEVDVGILTPETALDTLAWDSIAKLSVMAFSNEHLGRRITGAQIKSFKVIGELLNVLT